MTAPTIHGVRSVYSASTALSALGDALLSIKASDRLTYADLGAVLGVSEDMAAKYCAGEAAMNAVTFGRGKREWNGRFTGPFDRLCVDSRPTTTADARHCESSILRAALALSVALVDGELTDAEVRENRAVLEQARDAIDAQLHRLGPKAA